MKVGIMVDIVDERTGDKDGWPNDVLAHMGGHIAERMIFCSDKRGCNLLDVKINERTTSCKKDKFFLCSVRQQAIKQMEKWRCNSMHS